MASVLTAAVTSNTLSNSSSNLLSPKSSFISVNSPHLAHNKLNNQEMLKTYSKSVDCTHYLDASVNTNNSAGSSSNLCVQNMNLRSSNDSLRKQENNNQNQNQNQNSTSSTSINKAQSQKSSTISNYSPLIPRRNDYEPVARVTIQRQQRVEQSPSKLLIFCQ